MTVPICFIDTETTDIGPRRLPWEVAVIRREPDGTRQELRLFVAVDLSDANPFALKVGGFYERHPLGMWLAAGAQHPVDALRTFPAPGMWPDPGQPEGNGYVTQETAALLWCRWTHGAHIIGAVPNFDTEVMAAASRTAGLLPGHHYHLADAENLIVGYLLGKMQGGCLDEDAIETTRILCSPPWSSDDLFAAVGVTTPGEDRHTALGDARTVERVWDALYGTVGRP